MFVSNVNDWPWLGGAQQFLVTENVNDAESRAFFTATVPGSLSLVPSTGVIVALDLDLEEGVPTEQLTWSISGTDAFEIDQQGGLSARPLVNFESASRSYTFRVSATDSAGASASSTITVCVLDLNDAPQWETIPDKAGVYEAGPESLSWALELPFTDVDMNSGFDPCHGGGRVFDTHVFSVVGECPLYFPDSSVNIIKVNPAKSLDYETEPTMTCTFRVTDVTSKSNGAKSADRTETFTVLDYNEAPDVLWPFVTLYEDNSCGGGYVDLPRTTEDVCLGALMLAKPVASDNVAASGMVKSIRLGAGVSVSVSLGGSQAGQTFFLTGAAADPKCFDISFVNALCVRVTASVSANSAVTISWHENTAVDQSWALNVANYEQLVGDSLEFSLVGETFGLVVDEATGVLTLPKNALNFEDHFFLDPHLASLSLQLKVVDTLVCCGKDDVNTVIQDVLIEVHDVNESPVFRLGGVTAGTSLVLDEVTVSVYNRRQCIHLRADDPDEYLSNILTYSLDTILSTLFDRNSFEVIV
jgi:hypothetical protein